MIIKKILLIITLTITNISSSSQAQTILEEIVETGVLKVGISADAPPFGYRDNTGDLRGYCLDIIALVREEIKEKFAREIISIKIFTSTQNSRYQLVEDRVVDFECGPNSISTNIENNVSFTKPFFITGTKFLIEKQSEFNIDLDSNLENLNIGVLGNTEIETRISNEYPAANLITFRGTSGRMRGIQALNLDRIDAFVSDGVLLLGEIVIMDLSLENYELIPLNPLTCEFYGLVIPPEDKEWENFLNGVIDKSQKDKDKIFNEGFKIIESNTIETRDFCLAITQ